MILQTMALLLDTYRDLNSRRMFWIVLILSALVALSFAAIGLTPTGFEIFWWKIGSPFLNSAVVNPGEFYKSIFVTWGINIWLSTVATGLALISTASLFPDFLAAGAIDLYLSKPLSRPRLFFTKYAGALIFVTMQIASFCAACFVVMGVRGGTWEPGIFLAVPIVLLFYSYLFCFCTLIGVWSRSTITAILLTILFWFGVFCVHSAEAGFLMFQLTDRAAAQRLDSDIARDQQTLQALHRTAATRPSTALSRRISSVQMDLDSERERRSQFHGTFDRLHEITYAAMTVLPKTTETVDLLKRELISRARLRGEADEAENSNPVDLNGNPVPVAQLQAEFNSRTMGWIIGTSLGFEAVVLALGCRIFCRRDY